MPPSSCNFPAKLKKSLGDKASLCDVRRHGPCWLLVRLEGAEMESKAARDGDKDGLIAAS